ncbi:MAG: amidohydrolase family protein [Acidimicrobiia bacterium]|nr:amidohydrolase family protein [Acidimicrobiia bacterium]
MDARGLLVLPGFIDTHSHHREPGFTHKEDIGTATRAAAAGGVTTTVGMPNVNPPVTTLEHYEGVLQLYARKALVDFNLHPAPTVVSEVPRLASAGALGFKVFQIVDTKRSYPHMPGLGVTNAGEMLEIFEAVKPTGRPVMVHPHNQELMDRFEQRYWARGESMVRSPTPLLSESTTDLSGTLPSSSCFNCRRQSEPGCTSCIWSLARA